MCVCVCVAPVRYMEADLPELVGPCNIDVWSESNLTGEEFNSKYVYECIEVHLYTRLLCCCVCVGMHLHCLW